MLNKPFFDLNNNKEVTYDEFQREIYGDVSLDNNICCNSSLDLVDDSMELQKSANNEKWKSNQHFLL